MNSNRGTLIGGMLGMILAFISLLFGYKPPMPPFFLTAAAAIGMCIGWAFGGLWPDKKNEEDEVGGDK